MTAVSCRQASDELRYWIVLTMSIPALINLIVTGLLVWTMIMIRSFRQTADEIISSTQWLSKTAVRIGIGPSAKKALLEYARSKPELQKLVTGTAG